MRTVTLLNSAYKIPSSLIHLHKFRKNYNDYIIGYEERKDFQFIDEANSDIGIIVEGLIDDAESLILTDNFFKSNSLLNGQFTIFNICNNKIRVATDFININRFAFYQDPYLGLLISNNIDDILEILKHNNIGKDALDYIDPIALIEQLGYQYSTLGNRTLIKGVSYLPSGCITEIDSSGVRIIAVDSIERIQLKFSDIEFQVLLRSNAEVFSKKFTDMCFPISGGVDSRITLHAFEFFQNKKNSSIITHGEKNDVEVIIGSKLAKIAGLQHRSISIQGLYAKSENIQQALQKSWNWVLGKWAPIIDSLIKFGIVKDTLFVFGDTLDLLRAKNLKSIRSRKKRIFIQLGLTDLNPATINISDIKAYYIDKVKNELKSTYNNYEALFLKLGVEFNDIEVEVEKDLITTMEHVERLFSPTNGYEFEEGLNLVIWGRGTMGNQARYINQFRVMLPMQIDNL